MIASVSGKILHIETNSLIVEVGGVGLHIFVPTPVLMKFHPGENVFLFTHLIVRQDYLALYGFDSPEGREYFQLLLSVDGVGPRLAVGILSVLDPESIRRAVATGQVEVFNRVSGIGKKTAQKILLYLQDRIGTVEGVGQMVTFREVDSQVLAALTSLGYSVIEAQTAIQSLPGDAPDDIETRLRLALQYFTS